MERRSTTDRQDPAASRSTSFTPQQRMQAAISLENARLYSDLKGAQAYLAEAQRLSATGSFGWKPASGEIVWSDETHCIFALDRDTTPTLEFILERTHPDDRDRVRQLHDRARRGTPHYDY